MSAGEEQHEKFHPGPGTDLYSSMTAFCFASCSAVPWQRDERFLIGHLVVSSLNIDMWHLCRFGHTKSSSTFGIIISNVEAKWNPFCLVNASNFRVSIWWI